MVTVTQQAASKIRAMLEKEGRTGYGLRMGIRGGGCSGFQYSLDFAAEPEGADETVEGNGVRLFIDPKSLRLLRGATLDYQEGLLGAGFKIDNPNARTSCGCGESFAL